MKKSKFSEEKIVAILKEAQSGTSSVQDICRKNGISGNTFYLWKKKYNGVEVVELKKKKELEAENTKLIRLVANLSLDNLILKDINSKKW
ncbi:MAG: transposase [Bacteriovorax sp.]|nr:transposase [Bacteriovorax sp.]